MKRIHMIIRGFVQGIGFRWFAQRKADQLGLVGFVRNLDDSVEIVAEGEKEKIKQFIYECKKGPTFSKVDKCIIKEEKPTGEFSKFGIIH